MQIVIKRCLLKDFSAVLDNLWDIKTTTKAILFRVAQIMVGLFMKEGLIFFNGRPLIIDIGASESRHPIKLGKLLAPCV